METNSPKSNSVLQFIGLLCVAFAIIVVSFAPQITSIIGSGTDGSVEVQLADTGNIDAFGRVRVSTVTSILDIKHLYDKEPLFVDEQISGTATSTFTESSVVMNTSSSGDYVIRETYQKAFYQNGKSQQILMTFDNFHPQTNIEKRIGYFSSNNVAPFNSELDGLFLSSENGTIYINVYRGGEVVEKVSQSNWNIDTLDGNGDSRINVNWDKAQIMQIDFEWLGVGRIRWGLVIDGQFILFHETNNANNLNGVYMLSPNQPMRWEIRQTGVGSGTFDTICGTVGTEGSINRLGVERSVNTDSVPISASSTANKYVMLGIRLDPNASDKVVDVLRFTLLGLSNQNYYWELQLDPNITGAITWTNEDNIYVDYTIGSGQTISSDGFILDSGFATGRTVSSDEIDNALRLGVDLEGNPQTIFLVVRPLSANLDAHGSLTWRELR